MAEKPLIGQDNPSNGRHDFVPNHLPHLANDTHLEPYSSGCRLFVVDRKAGGLTDARHSPQAIKSIRALLQQLKYKTALNNKSLVN